MSKFHPGEIVEVKGLQFRVSAMNYQGKLILTPIHVKENISDMVMRLQSTVAIEPGETKP